ncbi:MAG: molybdopterin molybdotransferase MoeA [Desulfomonilaceae bacterium]|nr:molybdopterin molybdotransferase MoeA [Desulfomonilaceae bacterium]
MIKPFLRVASPQDARRVLRGFSRLDSEDVAIDGALFRVLSEPIRASEDTPAFNRSTMDGFAVRASDTFGAGESSPALCRVVGEVLMGELVDITLRRGEAVRIWTGGGLPSDADAVVMVEHTEEVDRDTIEILKAVAPFDNVVRRGEDFKAGDTLVGVGHRLRPQDLGLLAAMGRSSVKVFRRPAVAVISSGDEIVPIDQVPPSGCMRDVNRHTIHASVIEAHAVPVWVGIAPDRLDVLAATIDHGLGSADMVIVSGGSSMGSRDYVIEAIQAYDDSEILIHGVSVSPGKPLILARVGSKPVVGLPGHPASALVCFEQFVVPLIRRLGGEDVVNPFLRPTVTARLTRNHPSREGRMDFVRVRLQGEGHAITATPVLGKSGMISAMVRAHGYICIQEDCEGLYRGDHVTVNLFSNWIEEHLEKEYLSGHEVARGSSGDLFESSRQEKLSRV